MDRSLETTGLDISRNEVLEIAAIEFGYADDRITFVIDTAFQQPSSPIEPAITLQYCSARARRLQYRIWADGAPFALKDTLKQRGYRWNDGADGNPKSWYFDADADVTEAEPDYLRKEIFQREDVQIAVRPITSLDRFSSRI